MNTPYLSIVVPVYNSEQSLTELVERIEEVAQSEGVDFEIIAVNDGSADQSFEVLRTLCSTRPNLIAINFDRNYGQQAATLCGLILSSGKYVVTIDDDLEYLPEDIQTLLFAIEKTNIQLIYGHSPKRGKKAWYNPVSSVAKRMVYSFCGLSHKLSSFRIVRQTCLTDLTPDNPKFFLVDNLLRRKIRPNTYIKVKQEGRKHGTSNYTLKSLVSIWFQFLLSSSKIGETTATLLLLFNLYLIVNAQLYAALAVILLALTAVGLTVYTKWIYRPSFRIKEKVNL